MNIAFKIIVVINAVILHYSSANGNYQFPRPLVTFHPDGFEVSVPAEPGMTLMAFHGSINKRLNGVEAGDFSADIRKAENGRFVYRNRNVKLNPGDKLYYWLHGAFGNVGYNLLDQTATFGKVIAYYKG